MSDKMNDVRNLRVIAAVAEKAASDLESNRLWEGEFSAMMVQISEALKHVSNRR